MQVLLRNPLADPPTNHLDTHHQIHVLNHFKQLAQT